MAATTHVYGIAIRNIVRGVIDLDTDTFNIALHTASYTPNVDTDDFWNDATNECSGTGYTAGGRTLAAGLTVTVVTGSNEVQIDAADVSWTALDLATGATYAVIFKRRGGLSSADELLCYVDLGGAQDPAGGDLRITWPSDGIFKFTYS